MTVFEYNEYKQCVNDWVQSQPKAGYGVYSRIAQHLGTNSVVISQVFKGDRDLNLEQAAKLCEFMNLGTLETDYLLLLVQNGKAGTPGLKKILTRQLGEIRNRGQAIKNRVKHEQLTDQDKALFYSNWYFIATWLAATIPQYSNVRNLSKHFRVPEPVLTEVLDFLLDKGLLVRKGANFDFGVNVTHVPHDSPYVNKHHLNWRMKALQAMDQRREANLHYSAPMAMSQEIRTKVREEIVQLIQKTTKKVADSPSETLACLTIDFFDY